MDFLLKVEMVAILGLAIGVFNLGVWKEMHHGYLGILIFILGMLLNFWPLVLVGDIVTADDAEQHLVQDFLDDRTYQSPLHWAYGKYLWPLPWIQKLTAWANGLFGKKS